jgi:tetraacyldisaccharide 4'-kinase
MRRIPGVDHRAATVVGGMRRWVPAWWRRETPRWTRAIDVPLLPFELTYRAIVAIRNELHDRAILRSSRAPVPTLSVGNLSIGGTGKTPISAWLASRLVARGRRPAILLRGYGMDEVEVHRELNPGIPVVADARRVNAAARAATAGCDCVVLDDGFQHRTLERDLDLVLFSAEAWGHSRHLLPRGPWREPLSALKRADFVLVSRKSASPAEAAAVVADLRRTGYRKPAGVAYLAPGRLIPLPLPGADGEPLGYLRGRRVAAIATLAEPSPFFAHLQDTGAHVRPLRFADHHEFRREEIEEIVRGLEDEICVMTRKEAVKLRSIMPATVESYVLEQSVTIESGEAELELAITRALERDR